MNIGTLTVICDHIERLSPTGSYLEILLDDVNADLLMQQIVANLDPEDLLAYFKDDVISEYADKIKSVTLSPREQHSKFIASAGMTRQPLSKWDAKLDEERCYDAI